MSKELNLASPSGKELRLARSLSNIETAKDHGVQRSLMRSVFIVITCTTAMLINTYNTTSVCISLPTIEKDLAIEDDQLQWLVSAYSLSSGCLLLFFGRLADLYGRKRAFICGILCQAAFSLGCGFAQDPLTLAVLRGFQGIGSAAIIPSALGILAHAFPQSKARSIAFATFAAGAPVGGAFGMLMGGVLTQLTSTHWRSIFYTAAATSALTAVSGLISFDADVPSEELVKRIDWIGASLITIGLILIIFVLGQGEIASDGWKTPYIIAFLIIGIIMVALFLVWEWRLERILDENPSRATSMWTPPPLMSLSLWTRAKGRMAVILVIALLNWSAFTGWSFWVQLYYQNYLFLTPVETMVRFIPMCIVGCLCTFFVAMVAAKLPLVIFIVSGLLLTATAAILFALIDPFVTYWAFCFPSTVLIVFGVDFVYTAGTIFVAKTSHPHEQSVAGALFQTMTQIGTAFGLTISTIVFNTVVDNESAKLGVTVNANTHAPMSAQLVGYKDAQWTSAAFALMGALLAALFLHSVGIVGHEKVIRHVDSDETMAVRPESNGTAIAK
ncbi:major facilitator superfamily domain-containing protein [Suillus bovinus]|uniref:major facilitator superfamily domain-containing protein n=1 Tax=Suillus bovinus TaxID=48563 RepID=UPI001B88095F|nr:major facilitator superfamily domain-containing protein [Suillus bovinus]KAG2147756.1 major facilitator superfamily domain-containing protein [Suillus bovinus]